MTWIKICGMTNLEDAQAAVDAGADAIGFVFYEKSPRNISVDAARSIVAKLPLDVEKVGVFADARIAVADISTRVGLTVAQIYVHRESVLNDEYLMALPCRVIPAISLTFSENEIGGFHVSQENRNRIVAALLDSGNAERPGGTGEVFDWRIASDLADKAGINLVVAGGLRPENVGEAIRISKPWGVDVASGVESRPGKKDPEKIRAFVKAVRETDRKTS